VFDFNSGADFVMIFPPPVDPPPVVVDVPSHPATLNAATWLTRYTAKAVSATRVYNAKEYRFFRSQVGPPSEDDSPFDTNPTLSPDYTPTDTYADGTWWVSCLYFNGVLQSAFFPVGPRGEPYYKMVISSGTASQEPPFGPSDGWSLDSPEPGKVRARATYFQAGELRADEWAIGFTLNGADPVADTPDITEAIFGGGQRIK